MTRPCLTLILLLVLLLEPSVVADNLLRSPSQSNENHIEGRTDSKDRSRHTDTSSRTLGVRTISPDVLMSTDIARMPDDSELSVNGLSKSEQEQAIKALEASFLSMIGLNSRPHPKKKVHIPQYMLDMYKQHTAGFAGDGRGVRGTSGRTFFSANTIRSFFLTGTDGVDKDRDDVVHYVFNVTDVPEEETLEGAELRIYRKGVNDSAAPRHRIVVYEVLMPRTSTREGITRQIDTRAINPQRSSWEVFDISALVAKWRKEPAKNHGIEVRVTDGDQEPTHLKHVRLKRSAHIDSDNWKKEQPVLVTYSNDKKNKPNKDKRTKRSKSKGKRRNERRKRCKRRKLYVDFEEVGWNDWIVAPPGYNAYYCHGECPFVLDESLNSTNHAIVQNLVHSVDPTAVPKPCCVPTELSPVSLLYLDQEERVTLKNYKDMIVEACGCR